MSNDMLSQEEINALLQGNNFGEEEEDVTEEILSEDIDLESMLTDIEKDALGEIGNISMGTAATALSTLLNMKVSITTPKVTITTTDELASDYKMPFVAIDVRYKSGLEGSNILILNTNDAKIIADLMMGKVEFDLERELTELDFSAVSEAMNQMIGSASTSLAEMLMKPIDIEPPQSMGISFTEDNQNLDMLNSESPLIKISFKMEIGEHVDSNFMQLLPIEFGKKMVSDLMSPSPEPEEKEHMESTYIEEEPITESREEVTSSYDEAPRQENIRVESTGENINVKAKEQEMVVVKEPEFKSFDMETSNTPIESIDLVGDIPINIVVELGRTNKKISEILEFGQGTVIELDKLVGEALNIYANGKFIALGEVVVIDDNFGVRVTEVDQSNKKII